MTDTTIAVDGQALIYAHENGIISTLELRQAFGFSPNHYDAVANCPECQSRYDAYISERAAKQKALEQEPERVKAA